MTDSCPHRLGAQRHVVETSIELVRKQSLDSLHTTTFAGTKTCSGQGSFAEAREDLLQEVKSVFGLHRRPLPPQRLQASQITSLPVLPHGKVEYPQLNPRASTPGPSQNPLLSLRNPRYGLPHQLVLNFESLGVNSIYPWQSSCLLGKGLLAGETNLVYTAPTGGGKSLVGDVLLLKRIIEDPSKKAILVLPYVALVQEKLKWLRRLVEGVAKNLDLFAEQDAAPPPSRRWKTPHRHVRVAGFFGGSRARTTWADIDIAVCTIEKVNVPATAYLPFSSPASRQMPW